MNKKIIAIDFGYSSIKICFYNQSGVLELVKIPSAVAKINDPLDINEGDIIFPFMGSFYVVGGAALKVPRSCLLSMTDYTSLETIYPVVLSYVFSKYGGADVWDHCAIGLSMCFKDEANKLMSKLYESLMIDKAGFFMCFPQGISSRFSYQRFGLFLNDDTKWNDPKLKNYLIIDGGHNTVDVSCILDGKSAAGSALGIPNTGTISIAYSIQDYLMKEKGIQVSLREASNIVDNNGEFDRRGVKYNISDKVDEYTKKYITDVLALVESRFAEDMDGVQGVVIVGGLAYLFQKYIDMNDQDVIKTIEAHFPVSFLNIVKEAAEFYNVSSYIALAEKMTDK